MCRWLFCEQIVIKACIKFPLFEYNEKKDFESGEFFLQLNKIKLHSCTTFASAQSQITLDDDYNVPDYRPDIVKVLKEKGELHFDEVKAATGAKMVKGTPCFQGIVPRRSGKMEK